MASPRLLFVNLPVRDLKKSMEFFSVLGFEFNPKFTDDNAACMIVSEDAFVMLLAQPFFKTFTNREICDTSKSSEGLFASRAAAAPKSTSSSRRRWPPADGRRCPPRTTASCTYRASTTSTDITGSSFGWIPRPFSDGRAMILEKTT